MTVQYKNGTTVHCVSPESGASVRAQNAFVCVGEDTSFASLCILCLDYLLPDPLDWVLAWVVVPAALLLDPRNPRNRRL